jgi:hypothetical protein
MMHEDAKKLISLCIDGLKVKKIEEGIIEHGYVDKMIVKLEKKLEKNNTYGGEE